MTATVVSGLSFFIARSNLYQVVFHFLLMVVWAKIAENMLTGKTVDIKNKKRASISPSFCFTVSINTSVGHRPQYLFPVL